MWLLESIFQGLGISVTDDGKWHLGGALGLLFFVTSFVEERVSTWVKELTLLFDISITHPHAAYAALLTILLANGTVWWGVFPDNIQLFWLLLRLSCELAFYPIWWGNHYLMMLNINCLLSQLAWVVLALLIPHNILCFSFLLQLQLATAPLVQ